MKPVVKKARAFGARFVKWQSWALSLGILALVAGCATPIGVNYVDRRVAYQSLTANAISAEKPSSFSARELMNRNLYQRFEEDPAKALAELHASLASEGDEDLVFALTELSFFYAQNSGNRSYYLAAAVYAYAFLMPDNTERRPRGSTTSEVGRGPLQSVPHSGREVRRWSLCHTYGGHVQTTLR